MTDLVPVSLDSRITYSKALAASDLLPKQYRDKPANVLVALEYGAAIGLTPMAAIQGIHIIEGKPTASAQLIGALVRNAGHKLRVIGGDTKAVATIVRADDPDFEFRSEWTIDRAKAAGLTGKGTWKAYPANMLKARAITEVARDACPEVLSGVAYTAEELEHTRTPESATADTSGLLPKVEQVGDQTVDTDTGEIIDDDSEIADAEIVEDAEPSPAQVKALHAALNAAGLGTREDKLRFCGEVVDREIGSSKDLTADEVSKCLDVLKNAAGLGDAETVDEPSDQGSES